jgi:hypothetical protein
MRGLSPTADRDETPMVSDSEDETEGFESEWEYETDSVKEASEYDEDVFFDAVSDNPYHHHQGEDSSTTSNRSFNPFAIFESTNQIKFHTRLGHRIECIKLMTDEKTTHLQKTFAYRLFGERLVMLKLNFSKNSKDMPKQVVEEGGYKYEILGCKFERKQENNVPRNELTLFYALVEGPGIPAICISTELEKIANWACLPPEKYIPRLELLFSTAVKSNRKGRDVLIFDDLFIRDLEIIPEDSNVGCGFIPRSYIERFLGQSIKGKRTFCIQVRVFCPRLGIFKGMLMEKPGIDCIQLPLSMQKVGPSLSATCSNDRAALVVSDVFPSETSRKIAKVVLKGSEELEADGDNHKDDVRGKKKKGADFKPNKLKWMILSQFKALGVSDETLKQYVEESCRPGGKYLQHSCVVGVADPTSAIPPGHVFVTGVLGTEADVPNLFVTRFPCTEKNDSQLLPLVTAKPSAMSESNWNFLRNLPFGAILFGNPRPGEASLPAQLARGDLDGDLYFICWKRDILNQLDNVQRAKGEIDDGVLSQGLYNSDWFQAAQSAAANVQRMASMYELIGKLYSARKKLFQECGPECPDATAFGYAYKDSLEIAKHDRKVRLPQYLWSELPPTLHGHLSHIEGDSCCFQNDEDKHKPKKIPKNRSAASNSAKEDRATSDDHTSSLKSLEVGASVEIIGGRYAHNFATFERLTAKKVYVTVSGESKCLAQRNVRPVRPS